MTEGFNPVTGKWNKNIEISLGKRAKNNPEAKAARDIQKVVKASGKRSKRA